MIAALFPMREASGRVGALLSGAVEWAELSAPDTVPSSNRPGLPSLPTQSRTFAPIPSASSCPYTFSLQPDPMEAAPILPMLSFWYDRVAWS